MEVYLAWYHTGFTDDSPVLLGVYGTQALADAAAADHKVSRDTDFEFEDQATWRVTSEEIKGGPAPTILAALQAYLDAHDKAAIEGKLCLCMDAGFELYLMSAAREAISQYKETL